MTITTTLTYLPKKQPLISCSPFKLIVDALRLSFHLGGTSD